MINVQDSLDVSNCLPGIFLFHLICVWAGGSCAMPLECGLEQRVGGNKLSCQARCQVPVHTEPSLPACTQESGRGSMSIISALGRHCMFKASLDNFAKTAKKKGIFNLFLSF